MYKDFRFISHRGNITGIDQRFENTPEQILFALTSGYDCEIDLRYYNNQYYLGHDHPLYQIDFDFLLKNSRLWIHCKDIKTLFQLQQDIKSRVHVLRYKNIYFYHDKDECTLTSNNDIWTYPGCNLTENSICVLPEQANYILEDLIQCTGICSDNIFKYKEELNNLL